MVCGTAPFKSPQEIATYQDSLLAFPPELSGKARALIGAMMSRKEEDRPTLAQLDDGLWNTQDDWWVPPRSEERLFNQYLCNAFNPHDYCAPRERFHHHDLPDLVPAEQQQPAACVAAGDPSLGFPEAAAAEDSMLPPLRYLPSFQDPYLPYAPFAPLSPVSSKDFEFDSDSDHDTVHSLERLFSDLTAADTYESSQSTGFDSTGFVPSHDWIEMVD